MAKSDRVSELVAHDLVVKRLIRREARLDPDIGIQHRVELAAVERVGIGVVVSEKSAAYRSSSAFDGIRVVVEVNRIGAVTNGGVTKLLASGGFRRLLAGV